MQIRLPQGWVLTIYNMKNIMIPRWEWNCALYYKVKLFLQNPNKKKYLKKLNSLPVQINKSFGKQNAGLTTPNIKP